MGQNKNLHWWQNCKKLVEWTRIYEKNQTKTIINTQIEENEVKVG